MGTDERPCPWTRADNYRSVSAGSTLAAIGLLSGTAAVTIAAGYRPSAMVLQDAFGRDILGIGRTERKRRVGMVVGLEPGVIRPVSERCGAPFRARPAI
jgi:hypothetical protein